MSGGISGAGGEKAGEAAGGKKPHEVPVCGDFDWVGLTSNLEL